MIAVINDFVAGAAVSLLAAALMDGRHSGLAPLCGVLSATALALAFLAYQRWRFSGIALPVPPHAQG